MYGVITRWECSGLNQKEFCRLEGINYYRFKYWKTQQKKEQQSPHQKQSEQKPDFIPVTIPVFGNDISGIELTYPNGVKLSFTHSVSVQALKTLVKFF